MISMSGKYQSANKQNINLKPTNKMKTITEKQKKYNVLVYDITFYLSDEDGNEKLDKDGNVQKYACNGRLKPLEYLCEDMTEDDLVKIK